MGGTEMKKLNIGMIGYGFMGRTHSNAFSQVNHFFDVPFQPVLKTVCARNTERAQDFAAKWGYQTVERGQEGLGGAGGPPPTTSPLIPQPPPTPPQNLPPPRREPEKG